MLDFMSCKKYFRAYLWRVLFSLARKVDLNTRERCHRFFVESVFVCTYVKFELEVAFLKKELPPAAQIIEMF
jgi:hypothetical protein